MSPSTKHPIQIFQNNWELIFTPRPAEGRLGKVLQDAYLLGHILTLFTEPRHGNGNQR